GSRGPTTWPGCGVQVDVVRCGAAFVVREAEFDKIAFANPNETAGNSAAERPERVVDTISEAHRLLDGLDLDDHLGRVVARDWRRHVGRVGQHSALLTANRRKRPSGDGRASGFFAGGVLAGG